MEDWIVIEIDDKDNSVDFVRRLTNDDVVHFLSYEDAQYEVSQWNTCGKSYRFINLNE